MGDLCGKSNLNAIAEAAQFVMVAPTAVELAPEQQEVLKNFAEQLPETDVDESEMEAHIKAFLAERGLKFPMLGKPLRVALTGEPMGMGLGALVHTLGVAEVKKRIAQAV